MLVPDGRIFGKITQKSPQKIVHGRKKIEALKWQNWSKNGKNRPDQNHVIFSNFPDFYDFFALKGSGTLFYMAVAKFFQIFRPAGNVLNNLATVMWKNSRRLYSTFVA
jgi:hypothetical protein